MLNYLCGILIRFRFRFGIKSGICLLIVPVPVHCFSLTFTQDSSSGCVEKAFHQLVLQPEDQLSCKRSPDILA